ncbi:MAG: endonuclease/exonuclease/phosphatase family protein [Porphyrobacter sp. IPPAS B-1204]|nr:MAG: endonuclease/exonuclease/phosphatase family protein [Porphyrobacter sp. IPPAS B-1204]
MLPLKIMTWNIEHFSGHEATDARAPAKRADRLKRVIEFIEQEKPDVFGISEVTSGFVYESMVKAFPRHTFNITTGQQSQEILIGVRQGLGSFFTQKDEFKRNNIYLRPGALLTVHEGDVHIPILFVHLKSLPDPEGFGLRDAMLERIYSLKLALDKAAVKLQGRGDAKANFIVLGDYNTMGLDYFRKDHDIPMEREIAVMTERMKMRKMRKPTTSHPHTFFNGSTSSLPPSELDHVFVAQHVELDRSAGYEVEIGGWAKLASNAERDDWIERFSDHAPLIFTVSGV